MTPLEIKIELMRAGVHQADIARVAAVSEQSVGRVIKRLSTSDRIQKLIAKAINLPVETVFPEKYGEEKPLSPGLERLTA